MKWFESDTTAPFCGGAAVCFLSRVCFLRDSLSRIKCQHCLDWVNGEAIILEELNPSQPPHLTLTYNSRLDAYEHNSSETELQRYKGLSHAKVKAHENAVKQYIDLGVILLQEQNNNSGLWPETNRGPALSNQYPVKKQQT